MPKTEAQIPLSHDPPQSDARLPLVSVVIPARNESDGIEHTIAAITNAVDRARCNWEILVIDDGSEDPTFAVLQDLARTDTRIKGIRFSRPFGKEAALLAGLRSAAGDVVITMDADLQHPPELIPAMLEKWHEGARVVHAVKRNRKIDGWFAQLRAKLFNRLLYLLGGIDVKNSSDFKLLDRTVVDALGKQITERARFYRGLAEWVGHSSADVYFDVEIRSYGDGQWSIWRLMELALTALVSFTSAPLRIVTFLGMVTLVLGAVVGGDAFISWLQGKAVSGFATVIITLLLIGSFVMISLGIVGEYIAKIYEEVKGRPPYFIEMKTYDENSKVQVELSQEGKLPCSRDRPGAD